MPYKIEVFNCDFCDDTFLTKEKTEKHEKIFCVYNPNRRGCYTCRRFSKYQYQGNRGVPVCDRPETKYDCTYWVWEGMEGFKGE